MNVIAAATEVFSEVGFEGASINEISARSGVSKQNLFYHFGDKDRLWREVVDSLFAEVDVFFSSVAGADVAEAPPLRTFIRLYFEACLRFPAYVRIPLLEGVTPSWRADYIASKHLKRHVKTFAAYIDRLVRQDQIPPIDPTHLQNMLAGGGQLYLALAPIWKTALQKDTASRPFLEAYAEAVIRLLDPPQA